MWDASYSANFLSPEDVAALRYAFALARVSAVPVDNDVVEIGYATDRFRNQLFDLVSPAYEAASYPVSAVADVVPEVRRIARAERADLLELYGPRLPQQSLEEALRNRPFALALGGGGGVAYVFLGAFALLHEANLVPDLISGTSMGAILGAFRARSTHFDPAYVRTVLSSFSWRDVLRIFDTSSRYGIPATLKLFLHDAIGRFFSREDRRMRLCDLAIPMRVVVGGIAASQLGDVNRFAHLLEGNARSLRLPFRVDHIARAISEIVAQPLKTIVLGGDELTREFDVLDAVGFSSSVPAIIHYDILRDDPRMAELVERLLEREGVARLTDGGVVDNVPAKAALTAVQEGAVRRRDPFVLALDAFAPHLEIGSNMLFLPLMRLAAETSKLGYRTAHHTVSFRDVLSPLTVVPSEAQVAKAIAKGRAQFEKHLPFIQKMLAPIPYGEGIVDVDPSVST
jgi:predicted acylesterase/phospholipase RssA